MAAHTAAQDRRALLEAVKAIPPRVRTALASEDPALFAYYGLGVLLNDAQETEIRNVLSWPEGSVHVWRWANRSGKSTGLMVLHLYAIWKKWRYRTPDFEQWKSYPYKTLHSAPTNRLMGRVWENGDSILHGTADQQRHPQTHLQRKGWLTPWFEAGTGTNKDGSEALFVRCPSNNAKVDFLSTSDGAGRMESESWWLIDWDEFPRQQPVTDVPILIDQTFLPRSSDFMAPLVFAGTNTDDFDPIYAEIEEMAADNPKDWNFSTYARSVNFTQSAASIDRQKRLSFDKAIAQRSVDGESGEGGRGTVVPTILLNNAFTPDLPNTGRPDRDEIVVTTFDHAAKGDLNAARSFALPWPVPRDPNHLIGRIRGISAADRKTSTPLTPNLQFRFIADEVEKRNSRFLIVDASGEGGVLVYQMCKHELPSSVAVVAYNFTARPPGIKPGNRTTNKEYGLQWLQRTLGWGLDVQAEENGWVSDWPTVVEAFGLFRIPAEWRRDRRELAVLRRDDANLKQDRAMTYVMFAGWLAKYIEHSRPAQAQPFNIMARRQRPFVQRAYR